MLPATPFTWLEYVTAYEARGSLSHSHSHSRSRSSRVMASLTMAASFLGGGAAASGTSERASSGRRRLLVVKAARNGGEVALESGHEKGEVARGRRAVVLAVAAAAASAVRAARDAAVALEGEPKRGTPDAKKKYAPVCVTMPTASICHK